MGNQYVKPQDKLNYINDEVNSLRYEIRNFKNGIPRDMQQIQVQNLARYSSEVNSLKGKVKNKNLTRTMENISRTMNEILCFPLQNPVLDSGAIDTDSFIDVSINKRHSKSLPIMPSKKSRISEGNAIKHVPTIKEIDAKFKSVRPEVMVAIENRDSTQLRVLQQTIKVLATDLELIEVTDNTPISDRKEKLVSLLTQYYQKISVVLKDIRKSRDMDMSMRRKKNEVANQKLQEIQQQLETTDSLLTMAVKNEKSDSIRRCQGDLGRINEDLLAVETMEDDIKAIKMQMVDRIAWLNKYASDFQKKGSSSDLTKAQSNYEELIKEIARGKTKNVNELLIKFDSLSDFVNGISENEEPRMKQKIQLLNNIQATKSSMETKKDKSFMIFKKEREESKIPSMSEKIDTLNNQWSSIETDLKSGMRLSEKERKKIIAVLGKIQNSMTIARTKLLNLNKMKLGEKLNLSTPNLTVTPPIHNTFSSSLSINSMMNSSQKIKSKLFDSKMPKSTKINRDKKTIEHPLREDDTFSIIESIRIQVDYIKEKFDQIDDENHVKSKLESYKDRLEKYFEDKNETIVNNAKSVSAEIHSLLRKISKLKRLKEIYLFGKVEMIQEDIERLRKTVNDYPEMSKYHSFESLAKQLKCCKQFLSANSNISTKYREELLSKFQAIEKIFEKKSDIELNLGSLKEKVRRFSGPYKGVLYNKLEKDLNRILVDTSEYVENKRIADDISRETEKQLRILENRASLAQSFRGSQVEVPIMETGDILNNLKTELETIRNELQGIVTPDLESFRRFRSRLDLLTLNLYQLKKLTENEEKLKLLIYNDIDSLKSVVDAKIALGENSLGPTTIEEIDVNKNNDKTKIIQGIQEELEILKKDIEDFVGTTSDEKFYELDEYSLVLASRMEDMEVTTGTKLHSRKLQILKEIYEYGNLLDKRAIETEHLTQYERDIIDIENNIKYYTKSNSDIEKLIEKLKQLRSSLVSNDFNEHLIARQNECLERINNMISGLEATISNDEEKLRDFEEEFHRLLKVMKTSTTDATSKAELLTKLSNIKGGIEKLNPKDDSKKMNFIKEIEIEIGKILMENKVVEDLLKQLNEFETRIGNSPIGNTNSLENDLKKFYDKLNERVLSYQAKNAIIRKYNQISDKLKKLTITKNNYIGSSAFLKDLEQNRMKKSETKDNLIANDLDGSETRIEKILTDISLFSNSETSEEYRQLEDAILKENVFLKTLNIPKDDELYKRKTDLNRKLMNSLNTLDEKIQTFEDLSSIECQLGKFQKKINEKMSTQQRNEFDEEIISLQIKLGQITVDAKSAEKKLSLEKQIMDLMKQMKHSSS